MLAPWVMANMECKECYFERLTVYLVAKIARDVAINGAYKSIADVNRL